MTVTETVRGLRLLLKVCSVDVRLRNTARVKQLLTVTNVQVEDVMYDLTRDILARSKPYGRDGAAYFAPLRYEKSPISPIKKKAQYHP